MWYPLFVSLLGSSKLSIPLYCIAVTIPWGEDKVTLTRPLSITTWKIIDMYYEKMLHKVSAKWQNYCGFTCWSSICKLTGGDSIGSWPLMLPENFLQLNQPKVKTDRRHMKTGRASLVLECVCVSIQVWEMERIDDFLPTSIVSKTAQRNLANCINHDLKMLR